MILWALSWIIESYLRGGPDWNKSSIYTLLLLLFIGFYIWEAIGLIYTEDIKMGLNNLFGRLAFILFPVILLSPGEMIKKRSVLLLRTFAFGTFIFIMFCFCYAFYRSVSIIDGVWHFEHHLITYPWLSYFYGADLTIIQHPTYISMYVLISVFISLESWFDRLITFPRRIAWLGVTFILICSLYFLSSRAGILISLILIPAYIFRSFRKEGGIKLASLGIVFFVIALLPLILKNQRVEYLFGRVFNTEKSDEKKIDPRLVIWESTFRIIKDNVLFGVGIGDARNELAAEYNQIGEYEMAKIKLNAHNQFLEVMLENGIVGLILLCLIFILMFYMAYTGKNSLYGIYILMMLLFFLFETVLYRLAGVSFFSLFSFLLLHINTKK
jgi:O-antigen ligase